MTETYDGAIGIDLGKSAPAWLSNLVAGHELLLTGQAPPTLALPTTMETALKSVSLLLSIQLP
jgi:hypothetical protein